MGSLSSKHAQTKQIVLFPPITKHRVQLNSQLEKEVELLAS